MLKLQQQQLQQQHVEDKKNHIMQLKVLLRLLAIDEITPKQTIFS